MNVTNIHTVHNSIRTVSDRIALSVSNGIAWALAAIVRTVQGIAFVGKFVGIVAALATASPFVFLYLVGLAVWHHLQEGKTAVVVTEAEVEYIPEPVPVVAFAAQTAVEEQPVATPVETIQTPPATPETQETPIETAKPKAKRTRKAAPKAKATKWERLTDAKLLEACKAKGIRATKRWKRQTMIDSLMASEA